MAKKKGYTTTTQIEQRFTVIRALLAITVSLLFCFVLIFISSDKPLADIATFIIAPLTSKSRFALLLIRMRGKCRPTGSGMVRCIYCIYGSKQKRGICFDDNAAELRLPC